MIVIGHDCVRARVNDKKFDQLGKFSADPDAAMLVAAGGGPVIAAEKGPAKAATHAVLIQGLGQRYLLSPHQGHCILPDRPTAAG